MSEWIKCSERLPEIPENQWRTSLPVFVNIENFGVFLAYPIKWQDKPISWIAANIMCVDGDVYPQVDLDNRLSRVTHWQQPPTTPKEN